MPSTWATPTVPANRGRTLSIDGAGHRLELDGGLRLVADPRPAAEQRGRRVEQPPHARGDRTATFRHQLEDGIAHRGVDPFDPRRTATQVGGGRGPRRGHAPRLTNRGHSPRHHHGAQVPDPFVAVQIGDEQLASPQRAVGAETQTIERDAEDRSAASVARPGTRRRGRGGAERARVSTSSSSASLVERYSGWRSWTTTSGATPYRRQR